MFAPWLADLSKRSTVDAALEYVRHGFHVLPLWPLGDDSTPERPTCFAPFHRTEREQAIREGVAENVSDDEIERMIKKRRGPCGKSSGKHPMMMEWPEYPCACDVDVLNAWRKRINVNGVWVDVDPERIGVGLAMGAGGYTERVLADGERVPRALTGQYRRGDLIALDMDGTDGAASLQRMMRDVGPLPVTTTSTTGRGEHRIFVVPKPLDGAAIKNKGGAAHIYFRGEQVMGLDVRVRGGHIALAPTMHYLGTRYRWSKPILPPAELPRAWYELLIQTPEESSLKVVP